MLKNISKNIWIIALKCFIFVSQNKNYAECKDKDLFHNKAIITENTFRKQYYISKTRKRQDFLQKVRSASTTSEIMSILSWGKPLVEFTKSVNGAPSTSPAAVWTAFSEIKEGTAQLTVTAGNRTEAIGEGGEVVDTRVARNKYSFELQLFVKKGDEKPIEDMDGVVVDTYAVRLTPEDETCEGFLIENATVSLEETWTAADGKLWKYVFSAIKPASGNVLKPYVKE